MTQVRRWPKIEAPAFQAGFKWESYPYVAPMNKFWHLWAKALGEKAGNSDGEADRIAMIRTAIVMVYVITNIVIIAGVVRHWND